MQEIEDHDCEVRWGLLTVLPSLEEELAGTSFHFAVPGNDGSVATSARNGEYGMYRFIAKTLASIRFLLATLFSIGRVVVLRAIDSIAFLFRAIVSVSSAVLTFLLIVAMVFNLRRTVLFALHSSVMRFIAALIIAMFVGKVIHFLYQHVVGPSKDSPIWDALVA
ncbi:hypothetical protein ACG7TL_006132 [Trametes sanguinea]